MIPLSKVFCSGSGSQAAFHSSRDPVTPGAKEAEVKWTISGSFLPAPSSSAPSEDIALEFAFQCSLNTACECVQKLPTMCCKRDKVSVERKTQPVSHLALCTLRARSVDRKRGTLTEHPVKVRNGQGSPGDFSTAGGGMGTSELSQKVEKSEKNQNSIYTLVSVPLFFTCLYLVLSHEFHQEHLGGLGVEVKVET